MAYRVASEIFHNGKHEVLVEPVRDIKGLGRWVYCKYCYKNVLPKLSGLNQVVCSKCGYGLTPDFFSFRALKRFLAGDDYDEIWEEDRRSKEAKKWRNARGLEVF